MQWLESGVNASCTASSPYDRPGQEDAAGEMDILLTPSRSIRPTSAAVTIASPAGTWRHPGGTCTRLASVSCPPGPSVVRLTRVDQRKMDEVGEGNAARNVEDDAFPFLGSQWFIGVERDGNPHARVDDDRHVVAPGFCLTGV